MRRNRFPSYEDRFIRFSRFVEQGLKMSIVLLMASLILSQLLLHVSFLHSWLAEVQKVESVAS